MRSEYKHRSARVCNDSYENRIKKIPNSQTSE